MNKIFYSLFSSLILISVPLATVQASSAGTEMQFSGTLVDEPCTVVPEDTDIQLDFGTIVDKYLYTNKRTHSQQFTIHLQDCNIDDWGGAGTVTVRFEGAESADLPGYLAFSDPMMGAAIGIEEADGTFLGLNKNSTPQMLSDGSVALTYQAFVQGEPEALENKSLVLGAFDATATFFLEYP
ncbi:fimbrial protein [Klebsiella aerogenes]|uniref:fimbrial protein n=1 Tax=Klebsiella aerogenes TaxID=548 RepID=UPI002E3489A8|nr:fimbrial protein [Klebsiella aerogenes]MED7793082.1 fimbrial protein [Klebsiella aerogenes]